MRALRSTTVGLVVALAVTTFGIVAGPSVQAADGVCTNADDITVVIDFQELGGGVNVRCASGPASTGFDALQRAGINFQTTVRFPGFLCKIAGQPANDPCIGASPATAYWSYWIAARGGQWCYSNWGAGNRRPPPGTVEAWSFSYQRTSSSAPPPRFAVPAPLPGVTPAPLAGNDCDPSGSAPKPSPTAPPATNAPAPPDTAPPAVPRTLGPGDPGPGGGASEGGGGPIAPGDGGTAAIPTTAPDADTSTTVPGTAAGAPGRPTDPSAQNEPGTDVRGGTRQRLLAGSDDVDELGDSDEAAGSVDLSSNGSSSTSTPVGLGVALALVTALGVGTFFRTRRRRAGAE